MTREAVGRLSTVLIAGAGACACVLLASLLRGALGEEVAWNYIGELPPVTLYIKHEAAYPAISAVSALVIFLSLLPFVLRWRFSHTEQSGTGVNGQFPRWGVAGALFMLASWILAWSRVDVFAPLQQHTFTPLWISYIWVGEAFVSSRGGVPRWKSGKLKYSGLYLLSSCYWWFFEFLNRFVQNWTYEGISDFSSWDYVLFASISFSTVLPAIDVTYRLLHSYPSLHLPFKNWFSLNVQPVVPLVLLISGGILFAIPWYPNEAFAFVWLAPLGVLYPLKHRRREVTFLDDLQRGDWSKTVLWALSALVCGLCWEMWNYYSLAKWVYHVPYVGMLKIFEMPVLGFAGYLPFGVLCGLLIEAWFESHLGITQRSLDAENEKVAHNAVTSSVRERTPKSPSHIAIIMDGNGRWAERRGLSRSAGHRRGVERVEQIVRKAAESGVRYLTLFAFSTENWKRPKEEIDLLMNLLLSYLKEKTNDLVKDGVRLKIAGDRSSLGEKLREVIDESEARTAKGDKLTLVLAISYGGRNELCHAVSHLLQEAQTPREVREDDIRRNLFCPDIPDPDLIIRTSGEQRLSNFLLWQAAYAELIFSPVLWPDFEDVELLRCIDEYGLRSRRYGELERSTGTL